MCRSGLQSVKFVPVADSGRIAWKRGGEQRVSDKEVEASWTRALRGRIPLLRSGDHISPRGNARRAFESTQRNKLCAPLACNSLRVWWSLRALRRDGCGRFG